MKIDVNAVSVLVIAAVCFFGCSGRNEPSTKPPKAMTISEHGDNFLVDDRELSPSEALELITTTQLSELKYIGAEKAIREPHKKVLDYVRKLDNESDVRVVWDVPSGVDEEAEELIWSLQDKEMQDKEMQDFLDSPLHIPLDDDAESKDSDDSQ